MKLKSQVQQADRDPANSDPPIEFRVDDQRRQVKQSDLITIEVHISKRAPQPGSCVAGHSGILDEASQTD
jgi:hypothetical protein